MNTIESLMDKEINQQVLNEVIKFLQEKSGIGDEQVSYSTLLEKDLGITGDDGI